MGTTEKQPDNLEICAARFIQLALRHEKLKVEKLTVLEQRLIYREMEEFLTLTSEEWKAIGVSLPHLNDTGEKNVKKAKRKPKVVVDDQPGT